MKPTWLDRFGACRVCGGRAVGILMSNRNDSLGPHCERDAKRLIAQDGPANTSAKRGLARMDRPV